MYESRKTSAFAAALTGTVEVWKFQLAMRITQPPSSTVHPCTKNIFFFFGIKVILPKGIKEIGTGHCIRE